MAEGDRASPIEILVDETRAMREALHDLVEGMRREQLVWDHEAATLPRRAGLTARQRQRFRAHLSQLQRRRLR